MEFKFDFDLQSVAQSWRQEDDHRLKECSIAISEDADHKTGDVPIAEKDGNTSHGSSFFASSNYGDSYFTITDPDQTKQEWIESRRSVKRDIQQVVKLLVQDRARIEK